MSGIAEATADRDRKRDWAIGAALVAVTIAVYLPALSAGFIWDDDFYVTHYPTLRSAAGLRDIWLTPRATPQYYPLTHTSF